MNTWWSLGEDSWGLGFKVPAARPQLNRLNHRPDQYAWCPGLSPKNQTSGWGSPLGQRFELQLLNRRVPRDSNLHPLTLCLWASRQNQNKLFVYKSLIILVKPSILINVVNFNLISFYKIKILYLYGIFTAWGLRFIKKWINKWYWWNNHVSFTSSWWLLHF